MANTPNFALYKPSRGDTSVEVDTSLSDNFTKIDTELKTNKDDITAHKNNPSAHTSENITHADGSVRTILDNHEERIGGLETDTEALDTRVTDIETLGLEVLAPNLEGRIQTIESDVEGFLAPATFDAMDQQSYTFDEYRIGYVDTRLAEIAMDVKNSGVKGDGTTDDTSFFQTFADSLVNDVTIFLPSSKYVVNGSVSFKNKNLKFISQGKVEIIGTGSISFDSDMATSISVSDVTKGVKTITYATTPDVVADDYIEVAGTITHPNYTVSRYTATKVVAKVVSVSGNVVTLDRQIQYNLTTATASKLSNPYQLTIDKGISFKGVGLAVNHCVGGELNLRASGTRTNGSFITIQKSTGFTMKSSIPNGIANHAIVLNDCNHFDLFVKATRFGMTDGSSVKVVRANGIQHASIKIISDNDLVGVSTIYGARNLEFDVNSVGSGKYYRDNAITTSNRLETCQFSECEHLDVSAYMTDVDDQGLEFLNCIDATIYPKLIATLDGSTEGAIVVKETSSDIRIVNPVLRCYNTYGIKIECLNGANNVKIINPDIVNFKAGMVGIQVRDSATVRDIFLKVMGGYVKAANPISVFVNHNNVSVDGTTVETTSGHAIAGNADYLTVNNVNALGCNDNTIRAVVSSGANDKVSNVVSDGSIYVRDQAKVSMNIKRYPKNKVSRIFIDTDGYSIYADKGSYKISAIPTAYTWEQGQILEAQSPAAAGKIGWVCTVAGTPGTWKAFGVIDA